MNNITVIINIRKTLLEAISDLSIEKLNEIPVGFNNNIIWNLGNVLVSQQSVIYRCAGLPVDLDDSYFPLYKGGTRPESQVSQEDFETLKNLFTTQTQKMHDDFKKKIFQDYKPWHHAMTGIEIDTIDTAIQFLTFHESLHLGYIMALKKAVS